MIRPSFNEEKILELLVAQRKRSCCETAQYLRQHNSQTHRGVWPLEGSTVVVYGNDGFTADIRSQIEVVKVFETLTDDGIEILGFGTDGEGVTWAIEVASDDRDLLESMVWNGWLESCQSIAAMSSS